jgi:hypothetical protein
MRNFMIFVITAILAIFYFNASEERTGQTGIQKIFPAIHQTTAQAAEKNALQLDNGNLAAIENAAKADKYLFAFFYDKHDETTQKMKDIFESTMKKVPQKALPIMVDKTDPAEKEIVGKYNVSRAPMPLVLVIAPNGAITQGLPKTFTEEQLLDAFVSPGEAQCLKALQDGKVVLLCVQNEKTKLNGPAMKGAQDFKSDPQFTKFTEIIKLSPTTVGEEKFLKKLRVNSNPTEAITIFLAPPGSMLGTFKGATDKEVLKKTLMAAMRNQSCGPSSGSGCCPK